MGQVYVYSCEHCHFEQHFNHGFGFLVHSMPLKEYLKQRTQIFHYKTHNLLKQLSKRGDDLFIKAGFQIYICPKCKTLQDKIEVIVYNSENEIHKSEFRCRDCRSRLKLTNIHRLKRANCPKCHHNTFQIDHKHKHLWD